MRDKNIKRVGAVSELLHLFANQTHKIIKTKSNSYTTEGISLFRADKEIARIYSKRKKIVLIDDFNYSGAFGNGYSSWHVSRVFSRDWTTIICDFNTLCDSTSSINTKTKVFTDIIDYYVDKLINSYDNLDKVINDNNFYDNYSLNGIKHTIEEFNNIKTILKIPVKLIKVKYNNKRFSFTRYHGWSSYIDSKYVNNRPYDWLYKDLFTEDELEVLNCKNWIHEWVYNTGSILTKKEKFDLYKDVDRRNQHEIGITAARRAERNRLDKLRILNEEQRNIKELEKLDDWLSGNSIRIYTRIVYLRIRDDIVETTQNANVPLRHCELLYKKFKNCINNDTEWISNGSSIKIGYYHVSKISKDDIGWFIRAGCHTIREAEIEKFIKQYDLKW